MAMMLDDDTEICALRLGYAGGIVVAHHGEQAMIGSDLPALLPMLERNTQIGEVGFLEAGEVAIVNRNGVEYQDLQGEQLAKQTRSVSQDEMVADKGGYHHYMLKEIMEQPQAVASAMRERVDFERGRVELPEFPLSPAQIARLDRVVFIRLRHQPPRRPSGTAPHGAFRRTSRRGRKRLGVPLP